MDKRIRLVKDLPVDSEHSALTGTEWDIVSEAPGKGYYFKGATGQLVLALYAEVMVIQGEKV